MVNSPPHCVQRRRTSYCLLSSSKGPSARNTAWSYMLLADLVCGPCRDAKALQEKMAKKQEGDKSKAGGGK